MGFQTGFGSGVLGRVNCSLNADQIQTTVQGTLFNRHLTSHHSSHPHQGVPGMKTPAQALTLLSVITKNVKLLKGPIGLPVGHTNKKISSFFPGKHNEHTQINSSFIVLS